MFRYKDIGNYYVFEIGTSSRNNYYKLLRMEDGEKYVLKQIMGKV